MKQEILDVINNPDNKICVKNLTDMSFAPLYTESDLVRPVVSRATYAAISSWAIFSELGFFNCMSLVRTLFKEKTLWIVSSTDISPHIYKELFKSSALGDNLKIGRRGSRLIEIIPFNSHKKVPIVLQEAFVRSFKPQVRR